MKINMRRMKEMKKVLFSVAAVMMLILGNCQFSYAAEQETTVEAQNCQVMKTEEITEVKQEPDEGAPTLMTYQKGDSVLVVGEAQGDWYQVIYQDITGYVPVDHIASVDVDVEKLDEEFAREAQEGQLVVENVEYYRDRSKRTMIWGILIVLLVAGIFVTGIASAVRKKGEEKEESIQ